MRKTEEKKITKEQIEHLDKLVKKGREFGMIYKFDAIGILMAQVKTLKLEGSNGKAKGMRLAAELLSKIKPVKDVAPVTRCEACTAYDRQRFWCEKHHTAFPADGFCSQPEAEKQNP